MYVAHWNIFMINKRDLQKNKKNHLSIINKLASKTSYEFDEISTKLLKNNKSDINKANHYDN